MANCINLRPIMSMLLTLFLIKNVVSFMDMEELKSIYYGLDILNEPIVINQNSLKSGVQVTSKFGQNYQCTLPDHSIDDKRKEEEEKIAVETGIVEMLKPMGFQNCLFKTKDWWSYEFCFGKYIRQFHMEDGDIKGEIIVLGYYESDFDWSNETARDDRLKSKAALSRYHSQMYTLGTKCDLTNQLRRAEVRFVCEENSEDYLYRIDESETCVYTVTIMTAKICRHPYLKAPIKRKPVPITCNPVLTEEQYRDFLLEKEEQGMKYERKESERNANPADEDSYKFDSTTQQQREGIKKLLRISFEELFVHGYTKTLTKEEFMKRFGNKELYWEVYHEYQVAEKQDNVGHEETEAMKQDEQDVGADLNDEDEEILSKFADEIKEIKQDFQMTQQKVANIKKKLTMDSKWEREIENAIKEAEEELGVKVDPSFISGLSNTLDKLFNKLQDTENEVSHINKEIEKLELSTQKAVDEEAELTDMDETPTDMQDQAAEVEEIETTLEEDVLSLHDKVQAPPKTLPKISEKKEDQDSEEVLVDAEGKTASKTHSQFTDEAHDDGKLAVKNVDKDESLKFETEHTFGSDKTFHIIQHNDDDGKTNRFILVVGINTFKDEVAEQERQSSLEQNYNFVYREKNKKKIADSQS